MKLSPSRGVRLFQENPPGSIGPRGAPYAAIWRKPALERALGKPCALDHFIERSNHRKMGCNRILCDLHGEIAVIPAPSNTI
jgi:hypothetical protein